MPLKQNEIRDVNTLAAWLALDELAPQGDDSADLVILAGHAVLPNIEGAIALAKKYQLPLLISGGIGHATALLAQAMAAHPLYHDLPTDGKSEAEMLAAIAQTFAGLQGEQLLLETASRNGGENAAYSQKLLDERNIQPQLVVLVQDPLLQRRATETFRWQWRDRPDAPQFISWPVFQPQLVDDNGMTRIIGAQAQGLWSLERFISLLMGEVKRLRDDEQGYGPRGKGYFAHVALPDAVEEAWQRLMRVPEIQARISR